MIKFINNKPNPSRGPGNEVNMISESFVPGRVTVIIPTYNYAEYITGCLNSVFNQKIEDLEVIVVDDGSTDGTSSMLSPFGDRIRYFSQENSGLPAARNNGIKHATGEFIQFLDSDDILGENAIPARLDFLRKNQDLHVAVCQNKIFLETDFAGKPILSGEWSLYRSNLEVHLCFFNIAPPHAFLCRRNVISKTGFFDTSLKACEDYDYWLRATVNGFLPHYCPDGVVFYRRHPNSMSSNKENQFYHDAILHKRLYEYLLVKGKYPLARLSAGYLAFAAGIVTTINRLYQIDKRMEIINELHNLLTDVMSLLEKQNIHSLYRCDLTTKLYFYVLADLLNRNPSLRKKLASCRCVRQLLEISDRYTYLPSLLFSAIKSYNKNKIEATQLIRLSIKRKKTFELFRRVFNHFFVFKKQSA